jgi:twitching motility protein PilT
VLIASRRLGDFLIERRVLSRDLLEELLAREAVEGIHLSKLLLSAGLVSEKDLMAAVADQVGVPFIDLVDHPIRPDVHGLVPEDLARGYLAVAVDRSGDNVVVAMEDPSDRHVVATISDDIGEPVLPALAVRDELVRVVAEIYGPEPGAGDDWNIDELPAEPGEAEAAVTIGATDRGVHLDTILAVALERGASDLHLTVGSAPCARVHSALERLDEFGVLSGSEVRRLLYEVLSPRQRELFERERELDTSHALPGRGRFRVSMFQQRDSVAAVLRAVPAAIPSLYRLGLPDAVCQLADLHRGLVVITGPARSGRSTTLAALVDAINGDRPCHIVTIEDPIEFLHRHRRAIVNQRQVGDDTGSVSRAVRQAMRQDPDVLVVGSVPDVDTVATVLNAAEAGLLVFASLSVPSAVEAVRRLVEVFPDESEAQVRVQLATSLQAVVAQQLVPSRPGGLALGVEVLTGTPMVRDFLREGKDHQLLAAMSVGGDGMQTMEQALAKLVQTDHISLDVAADHCSRPDELRRLIRSGPTSRFAERLDLEAHARESLR